jgi:pimeloyl-ACP methyl ester carboxylesterase
METSACRAKTAVAATAGLAGTWLVCHWRSPMVRAWSPGAGERRRIGRLSVRINGRGREALVLLHGFTASGDIFGAAYDELASSRQLAIPDLLGFGRSMDPEGEEFGLAAHLDALDEMVDALGVTPAVVLGHSLGALVALHWAARRAEVERVIAVCAPLYVSPEEADTRIGGIGFLERLLARGPLAERLCRWMCDHRTLAAWLIVALEPMWPVPIARRGVSHTWPAYIGAMDGIIRAVNWRPSLETLAARGVSVLLLDGARDPAPVPGRSRELAEELAGVGWALHPSADHELPITHPAWVIDTANLG